MGAVGGELVVGVGGERSESQPGLGRGSWPVPWPFSHPSVPPGGSAHLLTPCRLYPVPLGATVGRKRGSSLSQAKDKQFQKKEVGEIRSSYRSAVLTALALRGILTEVRGKEAPGENPWGVAVPSTGEGRK